MWIIPLLLLIGKNNKIQSSDGKQGKKLQNDSNYVLQSINWKMRRNYCEVNKWKTF